MRELGNGGPLRYLGASVARLTLGAVIAVSMVAAISPAGSIFDDDFKPAPSGPVQPAPKAPEETPPPPRLTPTPPPAEPPSPAPAPAPAPESTPTPPPVSPAAPVPSRKPVPTASDLARPEKLVKEVFSMEYKVNTAAGKAKLARALLSEARQPQLDAPTLYVLYVQARDLACAGGDAGSALEAVRGLRDWFLIGDKTAVDMEHTALMSAAASISAGPALNPPRPEVRVGIVLLMDLAERELAAGNYTSAAEVAAQAQQVTRKTNDAGLAERVRDRAAVLQNIAVEFEKVKDALMVLRANPRDPAANVTAGKFFAFSADRFDLGMRCLSNGNDPALKALAIQELAGPADAAGESSLAAGWSASMKAAPVGTARDAMRRRAIYWYDQVGSQPGGLAQFAAARRADDLRALNLKHGLLGEYHRGDELRFKVFTRVDPRLEFNWDGRQPDSDLPAEYFSVRWTGYIKATVPGTYQLIVVHDDGARVWLDGQLILDRWGEGAVRDMIPVSFTGALQPLKIEFQQIKGGSNFGLGWILPHANRARAIPPEAFYHEDQPATPVIETVATPGRPDGGIALAAGCATLHNAAGAHFTNCINRWTSVGTWASWELMAPGGDYDVAIDYGCDGSSTGSEYVVLVGSNRLTGHVDDTGGWDNPRQTPLGRIHLTAGGQTLELRPTTKPGEAVMNLHQITLTPVRAN